MPQPTWVLLLTMSIPLWLQCTHLLMYFQQDNALSQSSNHLRLVSWAWQWVHFSQMASTVPRSQFNRAPLGCGGSFASWMCSRQICSNCVMLSCQYGPKSLSNVSNTLLNRSQRIKTVLKAKGSPNRQWSMMRTYVDIMVGTAGYSVVERSINFPAWIGPMILTVQLLHGGVNVMWRHLHNIRKNTSVFER